MCDILCVSCPPPPPAPRRRITNGDARRGPILVPAVSSRIRHALRLALQCSRLLHLAASLRARSPPPQVTHIRLCGIRARVPARTLAAVPAHTYRALRLPTLLAPIYPPPYMIVERTQPAKAQPTQGFDKVVTAFITYMGRRASEGISCCPLLRRFPPSSS